MRSARPNLFAAITACATATLGCNSSLDRGHVSVAGLVKPLGATASTPIPETGALSNLRLQSRQTLRITLSKDDIGSANAVALARTGPTPPATVFSRISLPEAGQSQAAGPLTLTAGSDGSVTLTGVAGKIAATHGLVYGTNALELSLYEDDTLISTRTLTVVLKDFAAASVALTSFTSARQISKDGQFQGWLAPLAAPLVQESGVQASESSYLQSGFFHLINP